MSHYVIKIMLAVFCLSVCASACTQKERLITDFERYREAIKQQHGIDIAEFKQRIIGGEADKQVTDYDLDQVLMGLRIETEHTNDKFMALEITMDHLQEIPDYYTRLKKMEEEAQ
jgi:hypothetical protein